MATTLETASDAQKKKGNTKFTLAKEDVLKFMTLMLLFGVILIFLYAIKNSAVRFNFETVMGVFRTSAIGIIIGGASLMIGVFVGFLFAIPKALQSNAIGAVAERNAHANNADGGNQNTNAAESLSTAIPATSNRILRTAYQHNDNLVEISDWLTKIIVGVGLTQLNEVPRRLEALGKFLGVSFGADAPGQVFSISVVLFFITDGFLISYLWTRLYFIKLLSDADGELDAAEKKLDSVNAELAGKDQQLLDRDEQLLVKDEQLMDKQRQLLEKEKLLSDTSKSLAEQGRRLESKEQELEETQKEAQTLNDMLRVTGNAQDQTRKPTVGDDPQKNQWGGQPERNGYKLAGAVEPFATAKDSWYKVTLTVSSTKPEKVLSGRVKFYVHPTFGNVEHDVAVVNGVAELNLVAYGAFTVGAVTSDGTQLELDLAELPNAPDRFKQL